METLEASGTATKPVTTLGQYRGPALWGLIAGVALVAFYLGIITLAQGWSHALEQFTTDFIFIGPLVAGFGTQVGLFVYLRQLHGRVNAGGVAASTGTSTVAMLACCAHHLADILPVVGLSGAALFLNEIKTPLLVAGLVMNLAGIAYLVIKIKRHQEMHCQLSQAS